MVSYTDSADQKAAEDVNQQLDSSSKANQDHNPESTPSTQQKEQQKRSNYKARLHQAMKLTPIIISAPSKAAQDEAAAMTGLETRVCGLVENLKSTSFEIVREATSELRMLAKDLDNQILIASCGAISPLVDLLHSSDLKCQENAQQHKVNIVKADAIEALNHVLKTGTSEARENAAATLYSLSVFEENKIMIGNSEAIGLLVELLENGTARGKKGCSHSTVSTCQLIRRIESRWLDQGIVDRAIVVLANLASNAEGRKAIAEAGGIVILLRRLSWVRQGEKRMLLQHLRVLEEGAVPPLVILSKSGTARAKEKANRLLQHLRNLQAAYNARKG
ncbi:U-box domain-containing protein 4 [Bienertia sinuspersici]